MARRPRICPGGLAYHVINRATAGLELFSKNPDYEAFERVLIEARQRHPMRLCAYVLMPNHFHLVLWPERDGQLSSFMKWLTMTHVQRWHAHRQSAGRGHVYQGRFKSFPIQTDAHFLSVCRYVERNPLRANLVPRAELWPWSSLACRQTPSQKSLALLDPWPVPLPRNWPARVNAPQSQKELDALHLSLRRGRPYGAADWSAHLAPRLGLQSTLHPLGRPRNTPPACAST